MQSEEEVQETPEVTEEAQKEGIPEKTRKALELLSDKHVGRYAATVYASISMSHYGMSQLLNHMVQELKKDPEEAREISKEIYHILVGQSMQPESMTLEATRHSLKGVLVEIEKAIDTADRRSKQEAEQEREVGFEFPFSGLSDEVGNIKPGRVFVMHSNEEHTYSLMAAYNEVIKKFERELIPATTFSLPCNPYKATVAIKHIPEEQWVGKGNDLQSTFKLFEGNIQGPVVFIEHLPSLSETYSPDKFKDMLKVLKKAAKRYKVAIITYMRTQDIGGTVTPGTVQMLPVVENEDGTYTVKGHRKGVDVEQTI